MNIPTILAVILQYISYENKQGLTKIDDSQSRFVSGNI